MTASLRGALLAAALVLAGPVAAEPMNPAPAHPELRPVLAEFGGVEGLTVLMDDFMQRLLAEANGLLYVGSGVSGGEEGALHGPSLMPGGSAAAKASTSTAAVAMASSRRSSSTCRLFG